MPTHTPSQTAAILAQGNVLVMAGAGAGKTRTLVDRCIAWLLDESNPGSLDRLLMVTFTEAAAAEMRKRIRETLEQVGRDQPANLRVAEQIALLDTAHISTLHSFCYTLVKQHFYELGLDPQVLVLQEGQACLMADEVLDEILNRHYAGGDAIAEAVQALILERSHGWDKAVRDLTRQIHGYARSLRDPAGWLNRQETHWQQSEAVTWAGLIPEAIRNWANRWLPVLRAQPPENYKAVNCVNALEKALTSNVSQDLMETVKYALDQDAAEWSRTKLPKTKYRKPIEGFFEDAEFLNSLVSDVSGENPLQQDWDMTRPQMLALLNLVQEFTREYAARKRSMAALDFSDLEQFALQLLYTEDRQHPSATALAWRKNFGQVFVDEYQDINEAQDAIIAALSGEGGTANRFMVGDVKQSIYRFRLAKPMIFQGYADRWSHPGQGGQVISLSENFRSHESILQFINPLFRTYMHRVVGGVEYDREAELKYGAPEHRPHFQQQADGPELRRVELLLRVKVKNEESENSEEQDGENGGKLDLDEVEKEAWLIGRRLRELHDSGVQLYDEKIKAHRRAEWNDMVILMRSPGNRVNAFAKIFTRLNIPLTATRGGFFEAMEIRDLYALLQLLDNPLQDIPLLAVLRSPLVGLTLADLAEIRLTAPRVRYWTALQRWHSAQASAPAISPTHGKVDRFLKQYSRWREQVRRGALSDYLEAILDETHYAAWCGNQERGAQRVANLQLLISMARQFDPLQRQGLFRFLRYVESLEEAEVVTEPATIQTENVVRLMSIHQSKGLEFPIVAVAGLGNRFNLRDSSADIILDETYGLCPKIKSPQLGRAYPSLPHWMASQQQRIESLGEELRLLYVAFTRAVERLILVGSITEKAWSERWPLLVVQDVNVERVLAANCGLDWIGPWMHTVIAATGQGDGVAGKTPLFDWRRVRETEAVSGTETQVDATPQITTASADALAEIQSRLTSAYPYQDATTEPAKNSATGLRRRHDSEQEETEQTPMQFVRQRNFERVRSDGKLSAADVGTAHHLFLQKVSLGMTGTEAQLKAAAERMREEGFLALEQIQVLDFKMLAKFWSSEVGLKIRMHATSVEREIPFTVRLSGADMRALELLGSDKALVDDFIVVQGVADLVVLLEKEIWLLDFKTDRVKTAELPDKIRHYTPQIRIYGQAFSRIYQRPVRHLWLHFLHVNETCAV